MSDPAENLQPDSDAVLGSDGNPLKGETSKSASFGGTNLPSVLGQSFGQDRGMASVKEAPAIRPVPRISIQVFCDSATTGEVFQKAAEDRRLSKAHMTVQMGGIAGAVEHFEETPTPNLAVVECLDDSETLFRHLAQLSHVCDPTTKVVVIGQMNDISMYRELIRQGISEYMVTPLTPIQIIETVSSLYVDPDAPPIGRTFAFVGAKGGVGSSTIAHNVGWFIAEEMNEDVTLVDLDLAFGTAGLDFNQDPTQGIADALTSPERVDDVLLDRLLVKCTDRLSLLTAPSTLDREFDLEPEAFESVIDIVRQSVPVVIIDVPHIWTAWSKSVLVSADEIVLTSTPELASLRNTKSLYERIKVARPNDSIPHVILNQVGVAKRPEIPAKDFSEAIGVEPAFSMLFEANLFGTASNNGQMLGEVEPSSFATQMVGELAAKLLGREKPAQKSNRILELFKGKKRRA